MSSRYLKDLEIRKSKIIHVYRNGDAYTRATFVILRLPEQQELDRIIKAIEEKVRLPLNRPIRKLFEISGTVVVNHTQIEDGKYYVAASAENFFPLEYGHPTNWVLVGPVRTNKYANVKFVSKSEEEGKPNIKLSVSNNVLSSTKPSGSNVSSKTLKNKISGKPKKLSNASKKSDNKNMYASEHVDNILNDQLPVDFNISINNEIETVKIPDNENEEEIKHDILINEEDNIEEKECINKNSDIENQKSENEFNYAQDQIKTTFDNDSNEPLRPCSIPDHPENDQEESNLTDKTGFDNYEELPTDNNPDDNLNTGENIVQDNLQEIEEIEKDKYDDSVFHSQDKDSSEIPPNDIQNNDEHSEDIQNNDEHSEDIQNNDENPDDIQNNAATKIQATFRGYQVRNEIQNTDTSDFPEDSIQENPDYSEVTDEIDENM